mmetsp:Transcript_960/g.1939  ORF Transcript_960/g.1939 Transcript_960/m.1939 type:complete len:279 (+) Transcript_960:854-1690(+)
MLQFSSTGESVILVQIAMGSQEGLNQLCSTMTSNESMQILCLCFELFAARLPSLPAGLDSCSDCSIYLKLGTALGKRQRFGISTLAWSFAKFFPNFFSTPGVCHGVVLHAFQLGPKLLKLLRHCSKISIVWVIIRVQAQRYEYLPSLFAELLCQAGLLCSQSLWSHALQVFRIYAKSSSGRSNACSLLFAIRKSFANIGHELFQSLQLLCWKERDCLLQVLLECTVSKHSHTFFRFCLELSAANFYIGSPFAVLFQASLRWPQSCRGNRLNIYERVVL